MYVYKGVTLYKLYSYAMNPYRGYRGYIDYNTTTTQHYAEVGTLPVHPYLYTPIHTVYTYTVYPYTYCIYIYCIYTPIHTVYTYTVYP